MAGLLKYAPEFMLITNPTVNSYKRFDRRICNEHKFRCILEKTCHIMLCKYENLFWAPKSSHPAHLSVLAQHNVAGLLKYAPEFMLIKNKTVNSYKRFDREYIPIHNT